MTVGLSIDLIQLCSGQRTNSPDYRAELVIRYHQRLAEVEVCPPASCANASISEAWRSDQGRRPDQSMTAKHVLDGYPPNWAVSHFLASS